MRNSTQQGLYNTFFHNCHVGEAGSPIQMTVCIDDFVVQLIVHKSSACTVMFLE